MPTTTAQEVKRVLHSEELLHPGDFVFIPKREATKRFESVPVQPPKGRIARWIWKHFGKKFELKPIFEEVWPAHDAIVINCPICNGPVATTNYHPIATLDPLTIEKPITCPYCRTFTFKVVEGKIMLA
ncbi:MAG TPA: hypothetical protein VGI45_24890 [Terracidiphilus sp.]|jgi:uncharacterized Zn-finger protein